MMMMTCLTLLRSPSAREERGKIRARNAIAARKAMRECERIECDGTECGVMWEVSRDSAGQIFRLNSLRDHTGTMLRRDEQKVNSDACSGMPTLAASFAIRWAFALRRTLLQKDAA